MEYRCIFLVKKIIEVKDFWTLCALCNKVLNFGTCKHHGRRFIKKFKNYEST
jgi:hypothetical protein